MPSKNTLTCSEREERERKKERQRERERELNIDMLDRTRIKEDFEY